MAKQSHDRGFQKRALIAESLKADPQLSNREHGRRVGVDHKTVDAIRVPMESRGEIPHVSDRTDTLGRSQHTPEHPSTPRKDTPMFQPDDNDTLTPLRVTIDIPQGVHYPDQFTHDLEAAITDLIRKHRRTPTPGIILALTPEPLESR